MHLCTAALYEFVEELFLDIPPDCAGGILVAFSLNYGLYQPSLSCNLTTCFQRIDKTQLIKSQTANLKVVGLNPGFGNYVLYGKYLGYRNNNNNNKTSQCSITACC